MIVAVAQYILYEELLDKIQKGNLLNQVKALQLVVPVAFVAIGANFLTQSIVARQKKLDASSQ